MQTFFILMAMITGAMLVIALIGLMISLEAEIRRNAPVRTPEWAAAQAMPSAKLTISEYNRLIRAERNRRHRR